MAEAVRSQRAVKQPPAPPKYDWVDVVTLTLDPDEAAAILFYMGGNAQLVNPNYAPNAAPTSLLSAGRRVIEALITPGGK